MPQPIAAVVPQDLCGAATGARHASSLVKTGEGGPENDRIRVSGLGGDDELLSSRYGGNLLIGGAGADEFIFIGSEDSERTADRIADFDVGVDLIRLIAMTYEDLTIRAVDNGTLIVSPLASGLLVDVAPDEIGDDSFLF